MTLMKPEVWDILLNSKPPHPGFEFEPVEYDAWINIRIFLDNFAGFSDPQREDLAAWVGSLVKRIRDLGIPCYLEGVNSKEDKTTI